MIFLLHMRKSKFKIVANSNLRNCEFSSANYSVYLFFSLLYDNYFKIPLLGLLFIISGHIF